MKSDRVGRAGAMSDPVLRSVNWQSTPYGLLNRINRGMAPLILLFSNPSVQATPTKRNGLKPTKSSGGHLSSIRDRRYPHGRAVFGPSPETRTRNRDTQRAR